MIYASLQKITWATRCSNPDCQHNPKYHDKIIGNNFILKRDVTCLYIELGEDYECYCYDCIDIIYQKLKPVLDKKLWPFI